MVIVEQQSLFDQNIAPPVGPEQREITPDELTTLERLEVMQTSYGFLPTTKEELTAAIGLVGFQTTPGKTARHLNEVLWHQKSAVTRDPAQAVRSITEEYASFASRAQSDHQQLTNLQGDVRMMMNPRVSLAEDVGDNPAVRQLVRYMDIDAYTKTKGKVRPGFDPIVKAARVRGARGGRSIIDRYSISEMEDEVASHVANVIAATTVGQTRGIVDRAVEDQAHRFEFWVERLREARSHTLAQPIAKRALVHLGVEV